MIRQVYTLRSGVFTYARNDCTRRDATVSALGLGKNMVRCVTTVWISRLRQVPDGSERTIQHNGCGAQKNRSSPKIKFCEVLCMKKQHGGNDKC